jgi:WD40 repeat protein
MKNKNGYVKIINNVFSFNDVKIGIMIRKMLVFLGLMLCFVSVVRADEKKVELIPVYEKTFEDTIVDVIFDTATVSIEEAKSMGWKEEGFSEMEKKQNKCEILYPKVVILKKGKKKIIRFYEYNGKLKKTYESGDYAEVVISQNGKYIGVTNPTKWHGGDHESKFEMMNSDGDLIWELEGLGTGPYVPSPAGKYAIGEASTAVENAPISIYSKNGLIRSIKKNFAGFWTSFSEDERFIAIGIPMDFPRGKVIIFDCELRKLNEDTTAALFGDVGGGNYIAFSPNSKYVVYPIAKSALSSGGIRIFNLADKSYYDLPLQGKGNCKYNFTKDEKYMLVSDAIGSCYFIDIAAKKILWRNIMNGQAFGSVYVSGDFNKIVVCIYPNKIRLLNRNGTLIFEEVFENMTFHYVPKAAISKNGDKLVITDLTGKIKSFIIKRSAP